MEDDYVMSIAFVTFVCAVVLLATSAVADPDLVPKPGFSWTPTSEPTATDDHHDRTHAALARAAGLEVLEAGIVGEKAPEADIVVTPVALRPPGRLCAGLVLVTRVRGAS